MTPIPADLEPSAWSVEARPPAPVLQGRWGRPGLAAREESVCWTRTVTSAGPARTSTVKVIVLQRETYHAARDPKIANVFACMEIGREIEILLGAL